MDTSERSLVKGIVPTKDQSERSLRKPQSQIYRSSQGEKLVELGTWMKSFSCSPCKKDLVVGWKGCHCNKSIFLCVLSLITCDLVSPNWQLPDRPATRQLWRLLKACGSMNCTTQLLHCNRGSSDLDALSCQILCFRENAPLRPIGLFFHGTANLGSDSHSLKKLWCKCQAVFGLDARIHPCQSAEEVKRMLHLRLLSDLFCWSR